MKNERLSDQLRYITIRILASPSLNPIWTSSGTGFLYAFYQADKAYPVLVTNKHVLDGASLIGLTFHVTDDDNHSPTPGAGQLVYFPIHEVKVVRHPRDDVDLAAIAIAPILNRIMSTQPWKPYIKCLDNNNLPSSDLVKSFSALEDVVMVGYPNGISDDVNNFPVIRRGITSTPYMVEYRGRPEFLADIAVYGGSSGSPIFVINEGSWPTLDGGLAIGTRFALIGVLYAGHTQTVNGEIVAQPVPTGLAPPITVRQMINLGICLKSALIEDLSNFIYS